MGGAALLAGFVLAPLVIPGAYFQTAIGDLVPLVVVGATIILTFRNAIESRGPTRLFWWLMTAAMGMWWFNQASWG